MNMHDKGNDLTAVPWADLGRQLDSVSRAYADRYGITRTPEWYAMKVAEEAGELVQWFLASIGQGRARGKTHEQLRTAVDDELADVVCQAVLMAHARGTDLGASITRKWLTINLNPPDTQGGPRGR
ncbi:pyrophosphatase [Nocardia sp. R16R-3T]